MRPGASFSPLTALTALTAHIASLPALAKTAAAGILIGTGGNVGAEGPVAVAGAALGSRIGRVFRSGHNRLQLLVGCGAAAGISAAFNAPIAGVFFALERLTVGDAFNPRPFSINEGATVQEIMQTIGRTPQTEFPVVDADGQLVGVVTYSDLRTVLAERDRLGQVLIAADLANVEIEPVTPRDSLRTALQRLGVHGSLTLPVVEPGDGRRLVGLISRGEILAAYDRELLRETP